MVFLIVIWLLFKYLGKEPEIAYKGVYEREVPSRDSPDVINAIVKNLTKSVDRDGFASVILNLYRKDYIALHFDWTPDTEFLKMKEAGFIFSQRILIKKMISPRAKNTCMGFWKVMPMKISLILKCWKIKSAGIIRRHCFLKGDLENIRNSWYVRQNPENSSIQTAISSPYFWELLWSWPGSF